MSKVARRRFSEIALGDTVELPATLPAPSAWEDNALDLVQRWSGSREVRLMHVSPPSASARPSALSGRIFARHLDDSRRVDIEIQGWDRGALCACAVVRAALA
jgi:hypothetical protein